MIKRTYFTMNDCNISADNLKSLFDVGDYANDIANMIYLKFKHNWIIFEDQIIRCEPVEDAQPSQEKVEGFLDSIYYIYLSTYEKYSKLLALYAANEDALMNGLTDTSTIRFNDTPQNGGDWSDDNHTTNITQSTVSRDIDSVMDKLDKVANKYRNLFKTWVEEFTPLFGEAI